jgi:hypothetical protein
MEAKHIALKNHFKEITALLQTICGISNTGPLLSQSDQSGSIIAMISQSAEPLARRVTTDFGVSEFALRLPIPNANQPRYWIGLHERWESTGRHKIRFCDCGLRIYVGNVIEPAVQILRLEWTAPKQNPDGDMVYAGKHAGHPHWHIDRSVLIGEEEYWHLLELHTTPDSQIHHPEIFNENTINETVERRIQDYSWLQRVHLPAHAGWMREEWDGSMPGPHQSEPADITELNHWWAGALRYLVSELSAMAM